MEEEISEGKQMQGSLPIIMTEIYESRIKQIFGTIEAAPADQNPKQLQAIAERQYKIFLEQSAQVLGIEDKETDPFLIGSQDLQALQDQEFRYKQYIKKIMNESSKHKLRITNLSDVMLYPKQFMKRHNITLAQIRRMQKEVTIMILFSTLQFKQLLSQKGQEETKKIKQRETMIQFQAKEIANIKQYYPEEYEQILAFSHTAKHKVIKQRKNKNIK